MYLNEATLELKNIKFLEEIYENSYQVEYLLQEGLISDSKEKIKSLFKKFFNKSNIKEKTKTVKKVQNILEKKLITSGVNLKSIKNQIKKEIDDPSLKKEFIELDNKQIFQSKLNNKFKSLKETIHMVARTETNKLKKSKQANEIPKDKYEQILSGFSKSIVLFCILYATMVVVSIFFAGILVPLGLVDYLFTLSCLIIAPIFEELAKYISIQNDHPWTFFIVFNAFEFTQYVISLTSMGMPFFVAILIRLLAVGMHLSTTLVQSKFFQIAKEKNNAMYDKIGLFIGMIMHFLWNLNAILGHI